MSSHLKAVRRLAVAAAVVGMIVAAAPAARASFTYSVSPVTISTNFGAGSNLTVTAFNNGANSSVLSGEQIINIGLISNTSTTVAPPTDTGTIPISLTITINNLNGGGSGLIVVAGDIVVTRSDTGGAKSTFVLNSIGAPITLGNYHYTLSEPSYSAPTVNQDKSGSLSVSLVETPEPGSMALLGLGVAVVAGLGIRRKLAS